MIAWGIFTTLFEHVSSLDTILIESINCTTARNLSKWLVVSRLGENLNALSDTRDNDR